MQIVLLERIERLGQMGDVVTVKPGYARNFLLPRKKALRATKGNLAVFEEQKAQLEANNLRLKTDAQDLVPRMQDLQISLIRQASEVGQLYGSVRSQDICDCVTEQGFTISRSQVQIMQPIKTLGVHKIKIVLHPEVSVNITLIVAQSAEEAVVRAEALKAQENITEAVTA